MTCQHSGGKQPFSPATQTLAGASARGNRTLQMQPVTQRMPGAGYCPEFCEPLFSLPPHPPRSHARTVLKSVGSRLRQRRRKTLRGEDSVLLLYLCECLWISGNRNYGQLWAARRRCWELNLVLWKQSAHPRPTRSHPVLLGGEHTNWRSTLRRESAWANYKIWLLLRTRIFYKSQKTKPLICTLIYSQPCRNAVNAKEQLVTRTASG